MHIYSFSLTLKTEKKLSMRKRLGLLNIFKKELQAILPDTGENTLSITHLPTDEDIMEAIEKP